MTRPLSYRALTLLFLILAGALIVFASYASYTQRITVMGQLVPDSGLVKIYPQQAGTVVEERAREGQKVRKGDILFVLSSDRPSSTMGDTQAAISRDASVRLATFRDELAKTTEMEGLERASLAEKISTIRSELATLRNLIGDQRRRYQLATEDYARYARIEDKGYATEDEVTQRRADVIDQKTRVEGLERDQITTLRTLADTQYQLRTLPLKYASQIDDVRQNIASAEQDLSESEARRSLNVLAPDSGTATAITVHVGQIVDSNQPLMAIVPEGSRLRAELYAPSRAVGFVRRGSLVYIRYDAYPYQKFGQYLGVVAEVAKTALSSSELTGTNMFGADASKPPEPLYRITVNLQAQSITAYGEPEPLHAGMLLQADLIQQTRTLYEWVLEPLYTVTGKLSGDQEVPLR